MDPHRGQPQCGHRTLRRSGLYHKKLTIIMKARDEPERSSIAFANKEGFMEYHRDEERFFELYSQVCYPMFAGGGPEPKQYEGFCERLATTRERVGKPDLSLGGIARIELGKGMATIPLRQLAAVAVVT